MFSKLINKLNKMNEQVEEQVEKLLDLTIKDDAIKFMSESEDIKDWNSRREILLEVLIKGEQSYNYSFSDKITKQVYTGSLPIPEWFHIEIDHSGLCVKTMKGC